MALDKSIPINNKLIAQFKSACLTSTAWDPHISCVETSPAPGLTDIEELKAYTLVESNMSGKGELFTMLVQFIKILNQHLDPHRRSHQPGQACKQ